MDKMPQISKDAQDANSTPKEPRTIRKIFNVSSWFVFVALLPFTILFLLSQNSIPGDLFYPIKRGMENVVLAAAFVSPATRAAFRTDLTTERFDEAEKLLLARSDIKGLKEFVREIQAAQTEVSAISDTVKKQDLQEKIQTSVIEYQKRLNVVKVQLATREQTTQVAFAPTVTPTQAAQSGRQNSQPTSSQIEPTTLPLPTSTPVPVPSLKVEQPPIPTNTPVPLPTPTPRPIKRSKSPTPTLIREDTVLTTTPILPTNASTQVPTSTPTQTLTPTPALLLTGGEETIEIVGKVQEYLDCLQTTPAPHSECIPPEIGATSFNFVDESERRQSEAESERDEGREEKKGEKRRKEKKNQESPKQENENTENRTNTH